MGERPDTEELRAEQLRRAAREGQLAASVPEADEAEQHQRRAAKADYLRQKLDEQARSQAEAAEGADEDGS